MAFSDSGHRPHADFKGEEPTTRVVRGPAALSVTLDTWGPQDNIFPAMFDALQSNWGNAPSRTVDRPCPETPHHADRDSAILGAAWEIHLASWEHRTGWCKLTEGERDYLTKAFKGQTLQQILEGLSFHFLIDGVCRPATHQIVRTRMGAAFMQHGGRDNDWRHRGWSMPETIYRADTDHLPDVPGLRACVTDPAPIDRLKAVWVQDHGMFGTLALSDVIDHYLEEGKAIYAALVDAGIPWQDARRLLPMGTQTYIHAVYNYVALKGVVGNRAEFIMDWEINCIAQLMMREIRMKCPPLLGAFLGSRSDQAGREMFAGLESWAPSGKYENPNERCKVCGHAKANHAPIDDPRIYEGKHNVCEVCLRSSSVDLPNAYHAYVPYDPTPRTHRPEQNPFWVLHPDSMAGAAQIGWVPTNGSYPTEFPPLSECPVFGRTA